MSLIDATHGVLMVGAYGWAFTDPLRKMSYNLTVTGLSVILALMVGTIELASVLAEELGLAGGVRDAVNTAAADIGVFGYGMIGLFIFVWLVSLLMSRPKAPGRIGA
jgi:high-affinity nickel-transport protein